MAGKCLHCKDGTLISDSSGHEVCTSCGALASDTCFEETQPFGNSTVSWGNKNLQSKGLERMYHDDKITVPKDLMDHLTFVCRVISIPEHIKKQAYDMLKTLRTKDLLKLFVLQKKKLCVSACVFISARNSGLAINLQLFSDVEKVSKFDFGKVKTRVCDLLQLEVSFMEHTDFIESTLSCNLKHDVIVTDDVKKNVHQMINVCKKLWLTDGRAPTPMIMGAFYLAWQAEDFGKRKCSVLSFSKKMLRSSPMGLSERVNEITNLMLELAKGIPWLVNIDKKTLPHHLKDILKFKSCLIRDASQRNSELETPSTLPREEKSTAVDNLNTPTYVVQVFDPPAFKKARLRDVSATEDMQKKQEKLDDIERLLEVLPRKKSK